MSKHRRIFVLPLLLLALSLNSCGIPADEAAQPDIPQAVLPDGDNCETQISSPQPVKQCEKLLGVPTICQYPTLPTGCESVAAVMALQYYNVNITPEEFARNWLKCSSNFYTYNDIYYGPDPNEVFAGDPFTSNSYGCFAQPIANAVNDHCGSLRAKVIKGTTLSTLAKEYLDKNHPAVVWATSAMREVQQGKRWYLQDGSEFIWPSFEHCYVFVGYNDDYFFFNDPMSGSRVAFQKEIAEQRFFELGSQAVVFSLGY